MIPTGRGPARADLPYLLTIAGCVLVLIPFLAVADPFSPGGGGGGTGAGPVTSSSTSQVTTTTATTVAPTVTTTRAVPATAEGRGEVVFVATCQPCHGPGGRGIDGLGKPLTTSEFVAATADADLVAFLVVGRAETDPANTTGVAMPARGGNSALTGEDLRDVVAYLRTLSG